jgi:hypothetical protein
VGGGDGRCVILCVFYISFEVKGKGARKNNNLTSPS